MLPDTKDKTCKIKLNMNKLTKPVPVIIFLKALGATNEQEICQMVGMGHIDGADSILLACLQDAHKEKIFTQEQ
eukprot:gene25655-11364_t